MGITLDGGHDRHEEHVADAVPPSTDRAFAGMSATVLVHRRDADEGSNFSAVDFAELRQLTEQCEGQDFSDAVDAHEELHLFGPLDVIRNHVVQFPFDSLDFIGELFDMAFQACVQSLGQDRETITLHGAHLEQLGSSSKQVTDQGAVFVFGGRGFGLKGFTKVGNAFGIQAVGFCGAPGGLSETPDVKGVGNHDGQFGFVAGGDKGEFKAPGGLDDDAVRAMFFEEGKCFADSNCGVVKPLIQAERADMDIEEIFAGINADIRFLGVHEIS